MPLNDEDIPAYNGTVVRLFVLRSVSSMLKGVRTCIARHGMFEHVTLIQKLCYKDRVEIFHFSKSEAKWPIITGTMDF